MDRNIAIDVLPQLLLLSLSARRAWIEMCDLTTHGCCGTSLSARRAWIEICAKANRNRTMQVALRKESVDRNVNLRVLDGSKSSVALRKESVDRNTIFHLIVS